MNPPAAVRVTDPQGVHGTIDTTAWPLDCSRAEVLVSLESGPQVWVPVQILIREAEGRSAVPLTLADLACAGAAPREPPLVLPIIVEALDAQTRRVETGRVRLHTTVQAREGLVDEPLLREEVVIERVPVNRVVEGPLPVRYEGDTRIVSVLEEELVVTTRLRLTEELRITTRRTETHRPVPMTVRRADVSIERVGVEPSDPHSQPQEERHGEDRDRTLSGPE